MAGFVGVESWWRRVAPIVSPCFQNSAKSILNLQYYRRVDVIIKAHHNIFKLLGEFSVIVREMILDGLKPSLSSKYRT